MSDDDEMRYAMSRERIAAQEGIAQDRIRAQEGIAYERIRAQERLAQERGSRSLALQGQRLQHQRYTRELAAEAKTDAARITGEYDIELARLEHQQLPERLAIEHEFACLASELAKDELVHEIGTRALFSVVEFAAKAEISGSFDAERDERQFAHALELEKLRQQGQSGGERGGSPAPSANDLAAWYARMGRERG